MVRLWMIRHAESAENVVMHEVLDAVYVHRTMKPGAEMQAAMDAAFTKFYQSIATNGDSPVSEHGPEQCKRLGAYLPKLLMEKARKHEQGKIRVFVSAQERCMMTCDSFMRELHAATGLTALVKPQLRERPGLSQPDDDERFFPEFNALVEAGKMDEAMEYKRQFQWQPCGATKTEYEKRFPWARFDETFPEEGPWSVEGFGLPEEEDARAKQLASWVRGMQQEYKDGDLVIIVAHGGSQGMLLRQLLNCPPNMSFEDVRNTSITSLHLQAPGRPPVFNSGEHCHSVRDPHGMLSRVLFLPVIGVGKLHPSLVPPGSDVRVEFHSAVPHLEAAEDFIAWGRSRGFKLSADAKSRL